MTRSPILNGASAKSALEFLAGGGEMGELIRSYDWGASSIGAPDTWSPTLRMMVRFLLANRFPLLLWWGPEYIQIYNDPYRPIPGSKHPRSLGQPANQCWAEVWDVIGPLIDTPFRGGPPTWSEDLELELNRAGFPEETHFTVAYSPVPDDTAPGGIGGVLATVHEITEKIVGERRIVALRDLGARASVAKTTDEACKAIAATLASHVKDIPFALLYVSDATGKRARLCASYGFPRDAHLGPADVDLLSEGGSSSWPLAAAARTGQMQVVDDISSKFGTVPRGPWADPPTRAVVIPIPSPSTQQFSGFLVAGISSRLRLDDAYQGFLNLATSQIASAIANAQAYEAERQRAEALAEIDRAKTVFFSNISHEFRTPLTLMIGPLQGVLDSNESLSDTAREQLTVAHRNSLRLLKLVNSLLDFSRIEAGRVQASYEPVDLATLTRDLASNFRSLAERAGLEFHVDCAALPEPVYIDREMWEKIVFNLVSNAFKFTLEGRIAITIRRSGGLAELAVADTGTGIPEKDLPHIFDRFYRVEGAQGRTFEGTGIGLALVHELVKLQGGAIRVESTAGKGTVFRVSVPFGSAHLPQDRIGAARSASSTALSPASYAEEAARWLSHQTLAPDEGSAESKSASPNSRARRRILIVDDNSDMRDYLGHILAGEYSVELATNGEEALAAALASPPDLLVSDVMMPGINGIELLQRLRTDSRTKQIPVILVSARAGEEARIDGLQRGAEDYLIKPFSARELLARVRASLQVADVQRQAHAALQTQMDELERFNRVAVGRELRIIEMKNEVNDLCLRLGEPRRYPLDFESESKEATV